MTVSKRELEERIRWGTSGSIPAIVQDHEDGRVLMLAYVDAEALAMSLMTGDVHFHSRSRNRLWRKGETSGNVLHLRDIALDCDGDALLLTVQPTGPACHRGTRSCFDRVEGEEIEGAEEAEPGAQAESPPDGALDRLLAGRPAPERAPEAEPRPVPTAHVGARPGAKPAVPPRAPAASHAPTVASHASASHPASPSHAPAVASHAPAVAPAPALTPPPPAAPAAPAAARETATPSPAPAPPQAPAPAPAQAPAPAPAQAPAPAPARPPAPSPAPAQAPEAPAPLGQGFAWLETLWTTIDSRSSADPAVSYTARLLAAGVDGPARKVGEEAMEVVLAAKNDAGANEDQRPETQEALAGEVADLLYHTLVLLRERGLEPGDVIARLRERHKP